MIPYNKLTKIPYGGDYNPEQWPEEIWEEDMRLFHKAHINIVTINVFSWASIQPSEDTYDFSRLDRIVNLARQNNLKICMATSTGAHPAWMAHRHPDILRTEFDGRRRKFGGRHNSCPSSTTYRLYAERLARKLARRYRDVPEIVAWHVSNEFGGECYCEHCEAAFREWLKKRYRSLDELNKAWDTAFWGHTFYSWEEIVSPSMLTEHFGENQTQFQGISLDYRRFMSDAMLECYNLEKTAIKEEIPEAAVTTNMMGFFKLLDYAKWAKDVDFVSWDNYPSIEDSPQVVAMRHDLMRSIHGGDAFWLMEQTPSVTNWHPYNALKRPGEMRLWSYQAMAHGADSVMFFQMRRSIGACEKYHGAVIDHVGTENTRVFREITQLGKELETIGDSIFGLRQQSKIAIIFDWNNWWAVEYSAGPSVNLRYLNEIQRFYETLAKMHYEVDFVSPGQKLDAYKIVIAPVMYMVSEGADEVIRDFVNKGGTFVTTFFSGYVNESDLVTLGGYPGKLRDILGVWVEEEDALPEGASNYFSYRNEKYPATLICDLMHLEGAVQVDENGYEEDFYRGMPVITRNDFGEGKAYTIATASNEAFYRAFLKEICEDNEVVPVLDAPDEVEAILREDQGRKVLFLLNHSATKQKVLLPHKMTDILTGKEYTEVVLNERGVFILK